MIVANEGAMLALGEQLAATLRAGDLVTLTGTLGAGKTVLCRGILEALGQQGEVNSPSYALIHEYDAPEMRMPVVHADLYRLENPEELAELGLFDGDDRLLLVEWPEKGGPALERADVHIVIALRDGTVRDVTIDDRRTAL